MTIVYWKDGCWIYLEELETMSHRTDGRYMLEVDSLIDEHMIDVLVRDALQ